MAIPIVLLPSLDAPTIERSPASAAAAAAAAAPEAFGSSIQTQWRTQQTMLLPEEPPPAYETLWCLCKYGLLLHYWILCLYSLSQLPIENLLDRMT